MATDRPVVAILGIGYWGKKLVRVFDGLTEVRYCLHEGDSQNRTWLQEHYPDVTAAADYETILTDAAVDAVVVATPISTHATLARRALGADKHVFVEKPLTSIDEDPEQLVDLADLRDRTLFVGYVFLYHEVFDRLADWDHGVERVVCNWHKLGSYGVDIVENLVCHEVSIARALLGRDVSDVAVTSAYGPGDQVDGIQVGLTFDDETRADVSVDRLSPEYRKTVTVITAAGEVLVWADDSLRLLDREAGEFEVVFEATKEPLEREAEAFLHSVETGESPTTDGEFGAAVNRTLDQIRTELATRDGL